MGQHLLPGGSGDEGRELSPALAGARAVWLSPTKASGLPSHPRTLSKYFCLYESEEAELHFGVGANS